MSVTITGASDDLIEIGGDIYQEFLCSNPAIDGKYLAFSDGTILEIQLSDDGVWRIHLIHGGTSTLTIRPAPANDEDNYSDVATLDGDVSWVVHGINWAAAKPVSTAGPELQAAIGDLTLTAHATGVVTRPDGTVRDD
jgi:hypothetical protein